MLLYPELNDIDEPGFGLDYLRECQPVEQLVGVRWLSARISGIHDAIIAFGAQDSPRAIAFQAIRESHWHKVSHSWEWSCAFGVLAAREVGAQWAKDLQTEEGTHEKRAEHILASALYLSRQGHAPEDVMLGIETIARMHGHHDREARLIVATAKALETVVPGDKLDEHWVVSHGADGYEANDLVNLMARSADDLATQPTAHKALVHWCEMRLHDDALALGVQLGTPTGATPIRRINGALRHQDTAIWIDSILGDCPIPNPRAQSPQAIRSLEEMHAPSDKRLAKAVSVYNAMLSRAHEQFRAFR